MGMSKVDGLKRVFPIKSAIFSAESAVFRPCHGQKMAYVESLVIPHGDSLQWVYESDLWAASCWYP